jgi:HlyD family secretion protein
MPNPKKRRKVLIFTVIGVVLIALTLWTVLRKRDVVITVQTEKVARRNLTEEVVANGRIQPVVQVKISAEVSGEIIELPVKEGQSVNKGDLLVKIKPDVYKAQQRSSEAAYQSALSSSKLSQANLAKAELEFKRNEDLFRAHLISDSVFLEYKTALDIAKAQVESAQHQSEVAKASLARVEEELAKTTIYSPLTGTVSKLNLEVGERVAGNTMMSGTEIMTVADLNDMEARVDIGETDIVLLKPGQKARLEVEAFKDRKFMGLVTEIANSSKGAGQVSSSQEATKFEVRIRIQEKEPFRPGMSVTAYVETRSRTNVLAVPIASVTTRLPKEPEKKAGNKSRKTNAPSPATTNAPATNPPAAGSTNAMAATDTTSGTSTNKSKSDKKGKDAPKPIEVVFVREGDHVKTAPVNIGIRDDDYWEITDGLTEGQEIVSGGYKAINRELEDGKKVRIGKPEKEADKEKK